MACGQTTNKESLCLSRLYRRLILVNQSLVTSHTNCVSHCRACSLQTRRAELLLLRQHHRARRQEVQLAGGQEHLQGVLHGPRLPRVALRGPDDRRVPQEGYEMRPYPRWFSVLKEDLLIPFQTTSPTSGPPAASATSRAVTARTFSPPT